MTQQPPEPTQPQGDPAAPAAPTPPSDPAKQPPWGDDANFTPSKAWELIQNLRAEKGDPALKAEFDALKQQQAEQRTALAKALGVAPDETSEATKLTETVQDLQRQFAEQQTKATRLEVAAQFQIPAEFHGWLTATDPAGLQQQAQQLVPMVQATLAARGQAPLVQPGQTPAPVAPAFAPIPGQGQPAAHQSGDQYSNYYDEHGRPRS